MFAESFNALSFKSSLLILLWIKPSYFQHGSSLSLENVCDSRCMHQTRLFSSAAVLPQNKFTELCSSASVVSQSKSSEFCTSAAAVPESKFTELCSSAPVVPQSKTTESCLARRPLCHNNLPRSEFWQRHFIKTDIFGTGQTNMLAVFIYSKKLINQPTVAKSTHSTKLLEKVIDVSRTHIPLKALMVSLKRVKLRCGVSEPVLKHISLRPAFTTKTMVLGI